MASIEKIKELHQKIGQMPTNTTSDAILKWYNATSRYIARKEKELLMSKDYNYKSRSLWDRITGNNKPVPEIPVEDQYENPAKIHIGEVMSVNTIDYSHLIFVVQNMWNWTRNINGKKHIITDYLVRATPNDGSDSVELLIRLMPRQHPDKANNFTHHFVVLKKFFACGWQDEDERNGIVEAVNDPKGELVWQRDTPDEARFWRVNANIAYDCDVAIIADANGNGKVEKSEVENRHYKLWDFHRETKDEVDQTVIEYLFVHQDTDSGDFEVWRGEEINPSRIRT